MTWHRRRFDYPSRDNPQRETLLDRRNRKIKRELMRTFRSVPVKRRVWWVTLTATQVSEDDFTPKELPSALTFTPQSFWCLSRRKAQRIAELDRRNGGDPALFPVEFRLCAVCSRPLLGPEAHDYRLKQMKPKATWHFPEGPACNMECKPHGRGPNKERMSYRTGRAA